MSDAEWTELERCLNTEDYGPALYLACKYNLLETVDLLLGMDVNVNTTNPMENNWTPLHVAAINDNEEIVMALLKAGAKPTVRSNTAELPQDYAKSDRLKLILSQHTKKVEFDAMVHTLVAKGDATFDELEALAANFTSVYDLRTVCSMTNTIMQCSGSLTVTSFKPVLVNVLAKIIDEKMVLDDNALVFFNRMLDFCNKCGFFTQHEYELWKHRALKVNVQHIDYLIELMRQVQENSWRLQVMEERVDVSNNMKGVYERVNSIQNVVVQRKELDGKRKKQRRMLGFLSMALSFMGNSVVDGLGDCVVDLANPMELIEFAVDGQSAESFLELAWENVELKPTAMALLENINLPKEDFISMLQASIRYDSPLGLDILQLQQEIGISVEQGTQVAMKRASCEGDPVVKPSKEKDAKSSTSTAQQEREPDPTTPSRDMQLFQWLQDVDDFIYHHTIEESK
ncbi:unnamed protein product [Aphanomyces euteiches]